MKPTHPHQIFFKTTLQNWKYFFKTVNILQNWKFFTKTEVYELSEKYLQ